MLCCCLPLTFDEMQYRHKYDCQTDGNRNDIIHIYEPVGKCYFRFVTEWIADWKLDEI